MICFEFQTREASETIERWLPAGTSLGALRQQLEANAEMDSQDRFLRRPAGAEDERWAPVAREDEGDLVGEGDGVRVHGPRRRVPFTDSAGETHSIFVQDSDTLEKVRFDNARLVPPNALFTVAGKQLELKQEAAQPMHGVTALTVGPEAQPPAPAPFQLLLMSGSGAPELVEWPGGAMSRTVADLRAFLGARAPAAGFLPASGETPIGREMEPYETLDALGSAPVGGKPLRIRIAKLLSTPRASGLGGSDLTGGGSAARPSSGAASGAAGGTDRLSLRDTRDLLDLLGNATSSGPPSDWFDNLDRPNQERLLLSFRHLHGLRFVPVGSEADAAPAYTLDRSIRPALVPKGEAPAVQVVLPTVTTQYAAFASTSATADSVRSMLSWNVGGSVAAEAKQGAIALKSSYTQTTESTKAAEKASLIVRVEYLVARGEIVVDPDQVTLAPAVAAVIRELMRLDPKKDSERIRHALAGLLETYGPYVPMRTLFGGKLIYRQQRSLEASASSETKTRKLEADLEAKVREVTMTAKGGFESSDGTKHAMEFASQAIDVTMAGGDPALGTQPYRWADSLDHAPWWSVISFAEVRPLFALLPPSELGWTADQFARDSGIVDLLSGPLHWKTYAAQLADSAGRPQPVRPPSGGAGSNFIDE